MSKKQNNSHENSLEAAANRARPTMAQEALALHRDRHGDKFAVLIKDEDYLPRIMEWILECGENKGLNVESVKSFRIHDRSGPIEILTKQGRRLRFRDGGGAFRVSVKNHEIYIVRVRLNKGLTREHAAGTEAAFLALFAKLRETKKRFKEVPKKGLWAAHYRPHDHEVFYQKHNKKITELRKFTGHSAYAELEQDAQAFFESVDYFTKYGQHGVRKVLLTGPPGTGKTSIALALLAKNANSVLCVDCFGSEAAIVASNDMAEHKRKSIVLAEELDTFGGGGEVSQEMLNWLDGSHGISNEAGTYLIFTTNYPERIDPRILKRPGRLDKIISVGALERQDARKVANMYLPKGIRLPAVELGKVLDNTTPAEVKELVNIAMGLARMEGKDLDVEMIRRAREDLYAALKEAGDIAREDMDCRFERFNERGPRPNVEDFDDEIPF